MSKHGLTKREGERVGSKAKVEAWCGMSMVKADAESSKIATGGSEVCYLGASPQLS